MIIDTDDSLRRRAKTPHELMMLNLFAFHLLVTPLILFSGIGTLGLLIPPLLSGLVIAFIYLRGRRAEKQEPWFVMAHWKLAFARAKLLMLGYGISALLLGLAAFIAMNSTTTKAIMFTVLTRVAIMPTVVMVFVTAVLESSGIYQAGSSEVPEGIASRFPPPEEEK